MLGVRCFEVIVLFFFLRLIATVHGGDLIWSQIHPRVDRLGFLAIAESDKGMVAVGMANPTDLTAYPGLYFSKDGREWIPAASSGAVRWRSVTGAGIGYVAVGDGGMIAFSKYGYVWESVGSGVAADLRDVTWTGTSYVAVGDEGVRLRSVDGRNWRSNEIASGVSYRDVFEAAGVIYGVGGSSLVISADDGLSWSEREIDEQAQFLRGAGGPDGLLLYSESSGRRLCYKETESGGWETHVVPGGRPFVGLEFNETNGFLALNDYGGLLHSEDGVSWTPFEESISSSGVLANTDEGWLVAGRQGEILKIGKGRGWHQPVSLQHGINEVLWHAGRYYAFGHSGGIYGSSDGVSWVSGYGTGSSDVLRAGVAFDGNLITVGARGAVRVIDGEGVVEFGYVGSLADLRGVASSDSRLVAVGMEGAIFRSDDGVTWVSVVSPVMTDLHGITFSEGRFYAVGADGVIIDSSDGVNWDVGTLDTNATLFAVAAIGGELVVVGSGGAIHRRLLVGGWVHEESGTAADLRDVFESSDGIYVCGDGGTVRSRDTEGSWKREDIRFASGFDFRSGVEVDGRMLLVGSSGFFDESVTCSVSQGWAVSDSASGGVEILRRPYSDLEAVVAIPGGFLAAGRNGRTQLSNDGLKWSDGDFPAGGAIRDLAVHDGLVVAAGEHGIMVSHDGIAWAPVNYEAHEIGPCSLVDPAKNLRRVVRGEFGWLAVGYSGAVLRSEDGISWHRPADPGNAIDGSTLTGAAHGAGVWVISGESGMVRVSGDGEEWFAVQTPTNQTIPDVIYFEGRFLASISDLPDVMLESVDGMSWVEVPGISGWRAGLLRHANGRCFGLGSLERISSTSDGTTWRSHCEGTAYTNDSNEDRSEIRGIAYYNGIYVAVGTRGLIARSVHLDGWTRIQAGEVRGFRRVSWLRGRLVALASPGALLTSSDGVVWTSHRAGNYPHEQLVAMVDNGSRALAVGKTVLVSDDLVKWEETGCPVGKEFTSVAWNGQRFMAGARTGEIYHSDDGSDWTLEYSAPLRIEDVSGIDAEGMAVHGAGLIRLEGSGAWSMLPNTWGSTSYRHLYLDGSRYLATGAETFSLWSADGVNWERIYHPSWWLGRVASGDESLFALSPDPSNVFFDRLLESSDGRSWAALPRFLPDHGVSVVAESGCLLTFHERGEVMVGMPLSSAAFQTEMLAFGAPFYTDLSPEVDANGDGVANIVARYFGLPVVASNPAGALALPQLALILAEDGALSVMIPTPAEAVPYLQLSIEASDGLASWEEIAVRIGAGAWESNTDGVFAINDDGQVVLTMPASFRSRFLRMGISESGQ